MLKFSLASFLIVVILSVISQGLPGNDLLRERSLLQTAEKQLREADQAYDLAGEDSLKIHRANLQYRAAISSFRQLQELSTTNGHDSLVLFSITRMALIHYYLGETDSAKALYTTAFRFERKPGQIEDSVLFVPYIYAGGIYYDEHHYDSALICYRKAEEIQQRYQQPLDESERLYNRLGVIYYENGDYSQARNYFEKAEKLTDPGNTALIANYRSNIASIHIKLKEFEKAKTIYEALIPLGIYRDEIFHNLGIVYDELNEPAKAITEFRKVNYKDKKIIDLYYNFSKAFIHLQQPDSSELYLQKALTENLKWNGHKKNTSLGLLTKFRADILDSQGKFTDAVKAYQQALMQFEGNFTDEDPAKNPEDFTEAYSYINLFQTLTGKAASFEHEYELKKDISLLKSSLDAYRAAFKLADHVEQTYNSDEARLFLNSLKHSAHTKPIDICIQLLEETDDNIYLQYAYEFDQQNKASVLSLNLRENEWRQQRGQENNLSKRESELRSLITRTSLRAASSTDSALLEASRNRIRDAEIELGKIREEIHEDPLYHGETRIPAVAELQRTLDAETAILSYHLSSDHLLVLLITANQFSYYRQVIDTAFYKNIDSFKTLLHQNLKGLRYQGSQLSQTLYKILIAPLNNRLRSLERLVIIPDDELSYLPFEALEDQKSQYLLEKYSIGYQFSTAMLNAGKRTASKKGVLAVAPFANPQQQISGGFQPLPASKDEVISLPGMILLDSVASKRNFLSNADHYGMIHLATHASVNNDTPQLSYIAFYPGDRDHLLFADEIANMHLDSTELVILSACETGAGQLVKGEGLMSLSRSFAYAGCPNIITSLWQAEDKATAFITGRLHHYLDQGETNDIALQLAKTDLLHSPDIDPTLKSPHFWAHLVFIGDYRRQSKQNQWWWIGILLITVVGSYLSWKKYKAQTQ